MNKLALLFMVLLACCKASKADDIDCLASVLEAEAKGEDLKGQLLVAAVVLNRVESANFPNTVCEVVNQPDQFAQAPPSIELQITAELILTGEMVVPKTTALYFHSGSKPNYLADKKLVLTYGGHSFYE